VDILRFMDWCQSGHAAVFLNVHFVHIGAFLAKDISCPFCPFSKAP
jgi:hypothetical protein